jgi:hypothetical protein
MTIQRKRGAQTQFHLEEKGRTDAIPFKMKYNLQEHDIEPSGEVLHPSNKADRSSCQDDKQTQPRRSQEAAKTQPRCSEDAAKTQPRRSQDAGTPCHASTSATVQNYII